MNNFATLDDSLVYKNNFFVYSHALVLYEETPQTLIFTGNKQEIYFHEEKIIEFIEKFLPQDFQLYACEHYLQHYPKLWDYFSSFKANDKNLPKIIRNCFQRSHQIAKQTAQEKLTKLKRN